jgi:hypothetical protein
MARSRKIAARSGWFETLGGVRRLQDDRAGIVTREEGRDALAHEGVIINDKEFHAHTPAPWVLGP